jgi:CBS domain-containing membrane protein
MKVKDAMTSELVTFREDDRLSLLNDVMTLGRIRHFPVVDKENRPVGMITQRDLFRAALSHHLGSGTREQRAFLDSLLVRDEMARPVATVAPDEELAVAVERMLEKKVGALAVVSGEKLVGLLTETDLLRVLRDRLRSS